MLPRCSRPRGPHSPASVSLAALTLLAVLGRALAAEPDRLPPSIPQAVETAPLFARHVVAVLDRLGCNTGACHGSFRGQNGFRLALFGGDAALDHEAIVRDAHGRRLNRVAPERSLLLLKPSLQVPHGGGLRLPNNSPEYRLLRNWIAQGAVYDPARESRIARIEITPREAILISPGAATRLSVAAVHADGSTADVTALARFETLNEETAVVDRDGLVSARCPGDTAILVRYAGQVEPATVVVPRPAPAGTVVEGTLPRAANAIDRAIDAKLAQLNILPSGPASDTEYLRRVSLDVIGGLPSPEAIRAFVADSAPDKRQRKVEELLARPEHAAYWATKLSDWTGNDTRYLTDPERPKKSKQWHDWLRDKLARNVPYSDIATGVVAATSCEGQTAAQWQAWAKAEDARIQGKGWDFEYGKRRTLDLFYVKSKNLDPDNLAMQVAYCFLGVKIECAQCHKHPLDRWTQADFGGFAAAFAHVGVSPNFDRKPYPVADIFINEPLSGISEVAHYETPRKRYQHPQTGADLKPKALGGPSLTVDKDKDPRVALAAWMTAPDNPFFARALVNRVWAHYFGRGLIDPADSLAAANPASHPRLLDDLARTFVASGHDLRALHRLLLSSNAYQRSSRANATNQGDRQNYSHYVPRQLGAEQVVDAIARATGARLDFAPGDAPAHTPAVALAASRVKGPEAYALTVFGRPQRQQTCDCERSSQPGLPQTLYLFNDEEVLRKIRLAGGRLDQLLSEFSKAEDLVEAMYLWTLARFPTARERAESIRFLDHADRRGRAEELVWALLNHREFIMNY